MKPLPNPLGLVFSFLSLFLFTGIELSGPGLKQKSANQKIQVAILLDVSNSMDGLIDQAKSQLWNMAKILGRVRCDNEIPDIEIALFEYGRSTNNSNEGYVKQISGFTKDLDKFGLQLNNLTTNGGDEFCGRVMNTSLEKLDWDTSSASYKVIFIAGNESFLQGNITYTTACKKAKEKGIIVNTIYCGDWNRGIQEHWDLGAECGAGSFTNINHNAKPDNIPTPYDSTLLILNKQFNNTYVRYGKRGEENMNTMMQMDTLAVNNPTDINKILNYVVVKSNRQLRNDDAWDLASVYEKDSTGRLEYERNTLPDSLKNRTDQEIKEIVRKKAHERSLVRNQIDSLNKLREQYVTTEKAKRTSKTEQTLETEIEKIIKQQIIKFKMKID